MAIIGEIRKRPKLLLVFVGLALAAFVMGDLIRDWFQAGAERENVVLVEGEPISQEDEQFLSDLETIMTYDANNRARKDKREPTLEDDRVAKMNAWNQFALLSYIQLQNEYLMIETPEGELKTLFYDGDTSQIHWWVFNARSIIEKWEDPFSFELGKQMYDNDFVKYEVSRIRMAEKYSTLLRSGFFATTAEAQRDFDQRSISKNISFAYKSFTDLPDEQYTPTDEEIIAYYKEHKNDPEYQEKPGKLLEIAEIIMEPSDADKKVTLDEVETLKSRFETAGSKSNNERADSVFVERFGDDAIMDNQGKIVVQVAPTAPPPNSGFPMLPAEYDSLAYAVDSGEQLMAGDTRVFGPYEQNGYYVMAKIQHKGYRKIRHILIPNSNPNHLQITDSVYRAVAADTSIFNDMVLKYSQDPGSRDSGGVYKDFDYNRMVPSFSKFCYLRDVGDLGVVKTNYGYHIVEVLAEADTAGVSLLSYLRKRIRPGQGTIKEYRNRAIDFITESLNDGDFKKVADTMGYRSRDVVMRENMAVVPGFGEVQQLYQFYRDKKTSAISDPISLDDRIVVAHIKKSFKAGPKEQDDAWEQVKRDLIKQKKAAALTIQAQGKTTVEDVAAAWNVAPQSDPDVKFTDPTLGQQGGQFEPYVIGALFANHADNTTISEPMIGKNGIYYIRINTTTTPQEAADLEAKRQEVRGTYKGYQDAGQVISHLQRALSKFHDVKDKRR